MHEYYFKIRKGDIEFECSTTDKLTFEEQLSDWINGLVNGSNEALAKALDENKKKETPSENINEQPQRSGFLEVKNLSSINEIQTPAFVQNIAQNFDIGTESAEVIPPVEINFEQTLQDSIENPKIEVVEKTDGLSEFEQYVNSFNPESQTDYLIVTAMFILNKENKERFSIKQLNAKLVPLTSKPIDHAIIQDTIEQGYIKIVPDLTGTSEFTEYTLTEQGEGYFVV